MKFKAVLTRREVKAFTDKYYSIIDIPFAENTKLTFEPIPGDKLLVSVTIDVLDGTGCHWALEESFRYTILSHWVWSKKFKYLPQG